MTEYPPHIAKLVSELSSEGYAYYDSGEDEWVLMDSFYTHMNGKQLRGVGPVRRAYAGSEMDRAYHQWLHDTSR